MELTIHRQLIRTFLYGVILFFSMSFVSDTKSAEAYSFLKYDVEIQGKTSGWMTSSKTMSTDQSEIRFFIDSKVEVDFIKKIDVRYNLESTFKNNFLNFSRLVNVVNKDTQTYTKVHWDGIRYQTSDGKKNNYITAQKIIYSIGCLYFKEPIGITTVFSEKYLSFCPIAKNGDFYSVSFPDGNVSSYKYQNGICVWVEAKQKLYKIVFRLKELR